MASNQSRNGNLFVISGPSGAGKGTLVARLLQRVPDVWLSVSATTRKPRHNEKDGVHYYFLDEPTFKNLIDEEGFLEWACVHGSYYGTLLSAVTSHIKQGKQVVLEIDVQGALQVRKKMPEALLVFIEPPSLTELERRLRKRGTETEGAIVTRMKNARLELSLKKEYDVVLVNNNIETATDELVSLVNFYANQTKD